MRYLKRATEKPMEDLAKIQNSVREIIELVRREGEAGVRHYSRMYDNWSPKSFKISQDEIQAVRKKLPVGEIDDIDFCQAQIRNFAGEQMKRLQCLNFEVETLPGVHLGGVHVGALNQRDIRT